MSLVIVVVGAVASVSVVSYTWRKVKQEESKSRRKRKLKRDCEPTETPNPALLLDPPVQWMCPNKHLVDMPIKVKFYADHLSEGKIVKGEQEALICPVCHSGELKELLETVKTGVEIQKAQEENSRVTRLKSHGLPLRKRKEASV